MKRVLIGMSGGVDSSVATYLLKKEGYDVIGVTMVLFLKEEDTSIIDAKNVCQMLGIKHYVIDLKKEFKHYVINNFITSYKDGKTPNPCVMCNQYIKFGLLWEKAKELNCDYIATGHYAAIKDNHLCKIDSLKDQSYFLYRINKDLLSHIVFPLSTYRDKEEIRSIANHIGLVTANKKDSQDICFIDKDGYASFLEKHMDTLPDKGNFVLRNGKILGQHKGLMYYTIGQRKGLGISYAYPLYVIEIDSTTNSIVLGKEEELYHSIIEIKDVHLLVEKLPVKATGKIRYKSPLEACRIESIDEEHLKIIFDKPVKSATLGQSLVLYDNDICLGGGIIEKVA